jgi:hypothetical protein
MVLRFMFARSTDLGATFSPFADVTTSTTEVTLSLAPPPPPPLTRLGGSGQWSDVRVVAARLPALCPTLGQWGMILMSLLLLTASSVLLIRRRQKEP